jgi:hypothetical protein
MPREQKTEIETASPEQTTKVETAKTCFIISPMGPYEDRVIETFIRPACQSAGYQLTSADSQLSKDIRDGIVTSLAIAPMVIAYLGRPKPDWNNNVILELGYRLATRLPYIIVCDDVPGLQLPFQIHSDRAVPIPSEIDKEPVMPEKSVEIVQRIVEMMRQAEQRESGLLSNQAIAVVHAPCKGSLKQPDAIYVSASARAAEIFGVNCQLVGRSLAQFIDDRKRDMPDYQFRAFKREQDRLSTTVSPHQPTVIATTPIVFNDGPHTGRAFLPIIVNYQQVGEIQEFTVLYLDVTSCVEFIYDPVQKRSYYVARIDPQCERIENLQPDECSKERADLVFMAYNSADRQEVRLAFDFLRANGCNTWYDEAQIQNGARIPSTIAEALEKCRAALFFVGRSGSGKYQGFELDQLVELMIDSGLRIVPVLLEGVERPPLLLRAHKWIKVDNVFEREWIHQFLREIML